MRFLLAVVLLAGCASGTVQPPTLIAPTPLQRTLPAAAASQATCEDLNGFAVKWQALLALRDWTVTTACSPIPASEEAAAISYIDSWHREIQIIVDPETEDQELILVHELAHALLTVNCEAKSEVVEEQIVATLSELLRRLEKEKR